MLTDHVSPKCLVRDTRAGPVDATHYMVRINTGCGLHIPRKHCNLKTIPTMNNHLHELKLYGTQGSLLTWIGSFLQGRVQKAVLNVESLEQTLVTFWTATSSAQY